ncbi:MAG: carboxypeptidase regulatory-like domain-containing protein [Acidobacteria bacterium]|nr:carboxypeptidase regulatory-like domain-containing protein [Acidobacteriota bacterium]
MEMQVRLLLAVLWAAQTAHAQLTTGTISASIRDGQSAAIAGATASLLNEGRGTRLPSVISSDTGDIVIPNIPPGTYTLEISQKGFKSLRRPGVAVSAGDQSSLGILTLEVGTVSESITVSAEAAQLQTQSAERSFTITPSAVQNLPIANRSFTALASLSPGVSGTSRIGDRASTGGSNNNIMMDGVSTMDTGNNGILLQMNVESIAEVKMLVSNYQAEYGRSSGLQISAVTKSGTNQFHSSAYTVMRRSKWNAISQTAKLNGDPKGRIDDKDLGYSIGGPIGRPGRQNKLFFFYAHEYAPRTTGGLIVRFRFPTALERAGDFSQTTDNNGTRFPYIKDPLLTGACSATNQTGCFRDGGVLGKIPASRLYQTGQQILNLYPMPNVNVAGVPYNYEGTRPNQSLMSMQPVARIDYQPWEKLRGSFKMSGWRQQNPVIIGSVPGFNDSTQYHPFITLLATTVNYSINPTTFMEGTYGRSQNELAGCVLAQGGTGPTFCENGLATSEKANLDKAGLGALPSLFPDAGVINPEYYAFQALESLKPPTWDGKRIRMVPGFSWGGRIGNAPPNFPYPGYLNINRTQDVSINLTKTAGRHTLKTGFYNTHSFKAQQRQGWAGSINFGNDANNPLDSGFGFANAALGVFSSYNQFSRYVEGSLVYDNTEFFVQDNWKVNGRLTLDYGVRFVRQQPQYDKFLQASNFLPEKWTAAQAPLLYLPGCAGASPCSGANRQARDPRTGQLLGPNSVVAIGTLVPGSGNATNGLFVSGNGIAKTTYEWPLLRPAPRFGMAYDLTGKQTIVLRGGGGLFYDRPSGNSIFPQIQNPPTIRNLTLRYAGLQSLSSGLTTEAPPSLSVYQYKSGLPATWQWNSGVQFMVGKAIVLDVAYTGEWANNLVENVDINAVDFGAAFLPGNQDPTQTSALPGSAVLPTDQMRAFRGYSGITQAIPRGWLVAHTMEMSLTRRFSNGLSFGLNDTILLAQRGSTGARLQHNADGTFTQRADQDAADKLLGNFIPTRHTFKGNFVWEVPGTKRADTAGSRALKLLTNDWRFSGVWSANTGGAYSLGYSYQGGGGNQNITGSPNYGGRVRILGDTGSGCSSDIYRQFNTGAFTGPSVGSVGLESGASYLRGCYFQALDLSIAREVRIGESKRLQFRLDIFNAPNEARITGRNTTLNLVSPLDQTVTNLPFDASGNIIPSRSQPKNAGVGLATGYQGPRNLQAQIRFVF